MHNIIPCIEHWYKNDVTDKRIDNRSYVILDNNTGDYISVILRDPDGFNGYIYYKPWTDQPHRTSCIILKTQPNLKVLLQDMAKFFGIQDPCRMILDESEKNKYPVIMPDMEYVFPETNILRCNTVYQLSRIIKGGQYYSSQTDFEIFDGPGTCTYANRYYVCPKKYRGPVTIRCQTHFSPDDSFDHSGVISTDPYYKTFALSY